MKVLVLLAAFALASASFVGKKTVDIKEDGTIFFHGDNGKQVVISKTHGPYGQRDLEIEVTGPNTVTKKIQIDNNNQINFEKDVEYQVPTTYDEVRSYQEQENQRSSFMDTQTDVLREIVREYQGLVDQESYQQLLHKVQMAVYQGKISSYVLHFLQALNEESKWNTLTYEHGVYGQQQTGLGEVLSKLYRQQKYGHGYGKQEYGQQGIYGQHGIYGQGIYEHGIYGQQEIYGQEQIYGQENVYEKHGIYYAQVETELLRQVLRKIFDRQVLATIWAQQNIDEQMPIEQVWEYVLVHHGIFDKEVLVQLVHNTYIRDILVKYGVFNKSVLEQIVYGFNNQQSYDNVLFEQLVNKHFLKYWLVRQGIFQRYFLGQYADKQMYEDKYYNYYNKQQQTYAYQFLVKMISHPEFRNMFVQYGIFNKEVLQQVLYVYRTQGTYSQALLEQLVNKQALFNVLMQYGFQETTLRHFVDDEILGLKMFLKYKYTQETPKMNYRQLFTYGSNYPEMEYTTYQQHPYGQGFVGIDIKKTVFMPTFYGNQREQYPTKYGSYNTLFGDNTYNKEHYMRDVIYGQQGYGVNQGSNQGYYNMFQGRRSYNQVPYVQQQMY